MRVHIVIVSDPNHAWVDSVYENKAQAEQRAAQTVESGVYLASSLESHLVIPDRGDFYTGPA